MASPKIPSGTVFSDLTVVAEADERVDGYVTYTCKCVCGNVATIKSSDLFRGHSKSCGCWKSRHVSPNRTHGMQGSKIYLIWNAMKNRCGNPAVKAYPYYGGRGITVSESWQKFENFYTDMGDRPEGMSLDRIDNSKGYSKENCKWSTKEEQANNKRNNSKITFNGETLSVSQWARRIGIHREGLAHRLRNWSLEEAMTMPIPERPRSKLTDEQVREIRTLASILTHKKIAVQYNVSRPAISAIVKGKTYRDLL